MQPIRSEDLFELRFPSSPLLSPDGAYCAFLVHTALKQEDRYQSEIWLAQPDSVGARALVCGRSPRLLLWLDRQTLLFTENREGRTVCSTVSLQDGGIRETYEFPLLCTGLWRLAGDALLVSAVLPASQTGRAVVLEEIPFWANGRGFTSGQRSALFLYRPKDGSWTPVGPQDGEIGLVSTAGGRAYYSIRYRLNRKMKFAAVRRFDLDTGVDEEVVEPDTYDVFWVGELSGSVFLYATDMRRYGNVENPCFYRVEPSGPICLADYDEGPTNDVTSDARYGASVQYASDGGWLYYIVTQNGCSQLARVGPDGRREIWTRAQGTVDGLTAAGGRVCGVAARGVRSAELYGFTRDAEFPLTDLNGEYFAAHEAAPVESWRFQRGGTEIEAFALLPAGFEPGRRYPAVLQVHGGPKLAYGPVFHHEMQIMRAQGYFVLFCNPRGSDGRGNAFMDVRGRYGREDYEDIMAFLEEALARWPQIDRARVGVCGGSYGGFMVNWIIGHTARFACAVSQRSISNMVSMFCTSDIGYRFIADQCAATPWDDVETLWRQSPLAYAHRAKTPTLFIHGAEDYRCDRSEAMQMFTALRYHGVESRLCLLEGENHELSRSGAPSQRMRRLAEILSWLERYLKPDLEKNRE
ncbi:MAG: S9 family peptidase [Provencibacterium sp.]|jgi:dipeptidyl aminopeptidase/acylaminoacyl peptidase|nr:S9 family peptidase [Provencibacterium sp.]